ncbi:cyclophilin-like fold protein [Anaerostipes sp.]|uniref:cyclophilin-like fold protein n=1 Tax=Anaerostipes sp. TaxID=1872530 RepID=UPI0025B802F5|nr:cyclophilin-like fold protein [Anaerostipes sp.]MBS7008693.1 hypothetical protein [Anaerostipes sp.]
MKKLFFLLLAGVLLFSCSGCSSQNSRKTKDTDSAQADTSKKEDAMNRKQQIRISSKDGQNVVFELNDSPAARSLYGQLPLSVKIDDYSDNEKIFYPPEKLNISSTPPAKGGAGTLAYYEPWGDVVVFYGEFDESGSLYEIGDAVSGKNQMKDLSGEIKIEAVTEGSGN